MSSTGSSPIVKLTTCAVIRCREHAHDARYKIKFFDKEKLVVIECIACNPPTEVCRFAIDDKRKL